MKSWLHDIDIEMYSTYYEGESVVTERFIRTLKNKIEKYITSKSKNVYIDKLADIVNECNDSNQSTVKMKLVDVSSRTYIDSNVEPSDQDAKFEFCVHVRFKSYFEDDVTQNCLVLHLIFRYFQNIDNTDTFFQCGSLKDCLVKVLNPLLHLIIVFTL